MLDREKLINDLIKEDPTNTIRDYLDLLNDIKAIQDAKNMS